MKRILGVALVLGFGLALSSFVPAQAATKKASPKVATVHHQAALININTATVKELVKIKGVGPKTAAAIVAYRTKHGNFKTTADIMKVKYVSKKKYEKIKHQITVE